MSRKFERNSVLSELMVSELVALKLPLLSREFLSSAANVLTNSLNFLHRTEVDFFRLNYVESDQ